MVKYYVTKPKQFGAEEVNAVSKGSWIFLEAPTEDEIASIVKTTGLPEDFLKAALDEDERARIEVDKSSGAKLIIVDMPVITKEADDWLIYSTRPIGIVFNDEHIATVCLKSTAVINDFLDGHVKTLDINKRTRFIYQFLYNNAVKFLQSLRAIDKISSRIQSNLRKSMKNKELLQLLDVQKTLVYFSTSLGANQIVLDKIIQSSFLSLYEEDRELLDDVIVENKQGIEMCRTFRDVLAGTMDANASVIANNQNNVMKFLAAITIILAIPQVISGLFGMNVTGVPFSVDGIVQYGFWIVTAIAVVISLFVALWMYFRKMF